MIRIWIIIHLDRNNAFHIASNAQSIVFNLVSGNNFFFIYLYQLY